MTSLSVENGERRGSDLRHIDVGWPLLRYGNRFSRSVSLRCEAAPRDGRCSETRLPSRSDSLEALASEVTELEEPVERPPPVAFLKPCRQLEKQYSATKRSIAGQLTALKGRLDRIAEDRQQHSHGLRLTGKETTSTAREQVVHKLRHLQQGLNEQTDSPTLPHCRNPISQLHRTLEPLVAPAAAEIFAFQLPLYPSAEHKGVPIPFQWKDAPGKAKTDTASSRKPGALKLLSPPHHGCHRSPANQLLPKTRSIHL